LRSRENGFKNLAILKEGIETAHALGRKFYLAANVFPHGNKLAPFRRALEEVAPLRPDAFIMADPGMIAWALKELPGVPVHLSVQAHAVNAATCAFWHDLGVRRVILARELKLREVEEIRTAVPELELEVFVHGSVCMAQSGRCMISNWTAHRDPNQGNCNNACRFPYELWAASPDLPSGEMIRVSEDEHGTYLFNARDLCALPVLSELFALGITSLKIEGRTRSPYYVAQVSRGYRLALDALAQGESVPESAWSALRATDTRGWTSGFCIPSDPSSPQLLERGRESRPTTEVVAQIRGWDAGRAFLSVRNRITSGERLELLRPTGTVSLQAAHLENHRGEAVDVLNPGLENCRIDMSEDPGSWSFLVRSTEN
jgi:putative protease